MSHYSPKNLLAPTFLLLLSTAETACTGAGAKGNGDSELPQVYRFEGRTGEDSVAYGGQVFRHALMAALEEEVEGLTKRIDQEGYTPAPGEVFAELLAVYQFDEATVAGRAVPFATMPPPLQAVLSDLGTGKNLQEKVAGNDPVGQHKDWEQDFVGMGAASPDDLVQRWFSELDDLAVARAAGDPALAPDGTPIPEAYVSPTGLHYPELLGKFLLGAVAYSQATDDYLDDDVPGKGLLSDHTEVVDGKPYTELEHAWDEAFGYFGAARDLLAYTDEEAAGTGGRPDWGGGYHDTDGDGRIDLAAEYNFTFASYAAKRDLASQSPTDFTGDIMEGFLAGRALLAGTDGPLTPEELDRLRDHRDRVTSAWEEMVAASVVHYINETIEILVEADEGPLDFVAYAKEWSELKGLALALQFHPRKKVSDAQFLMLQDLVGDAPILPGQGDLDAYRMDLVQAKTLLGEVYGFSAENLGDDRGEGGW